MFTPGKCARCGPWLKGTLDDQSLVDSCPISQKPTTRQSFLAISSSLYTCSIRKRGSGRTFNEVALRPERQRDSFFHRLKAAAAKTGATIGKEKTAATVGKMRANFILYDVAESCSFQTNWTDVFRQVTAISIFLSSFVLEVKPVRRDRAGSATKAVVGYVSCAISGCSCARSNFAARD